MKKIMQRTLLSFFVAIILGYSLTAQRNLDTITTGNITSCLQEEFYQESLIREANYWQFEDENGLISDTYGVTHYLDTPIFSRLLIDYQREAVFYQKGDLQFFYSLDEFESDTPCKLSLYGDQDINEINSQSRVNTTTSTIDDNFSQYSIVYPVDLLLAPAYIGEFPLLVDQPLLPYDGRGFRQSITFDELPNSLEFPQGRFDDASIEYLLNFYQTSLVGWELAPTSLTTYTGNPTIIPGDRQAFVSLWHPETEYVLNFLFSVPRNQETLDIVVTLPESTIEASATSVIEGSSQSLATKASFFAGWDEDGISPDVVVSDGNIEVYVLQNENRYWFVDLEIRDAEFEVLYSEVVTQSEINIDEFLPDWAKSP